ncbi:hypothetical protein OB919_16340 [Halobacteria archaeon AArc-curdl1]|uniref:Uncharacterized protein n=1 Tax=Natronosalvus hydrolyticus TaxID=2979988 RepID=A0AAP3E8S8_9EURY|nr:hypothetical protein [Halobacteria archaeon AArc-curdl1]
MERQRLEQPETATQSIFETARRISSVLVVKFIGSEREFALMSMNQIIAVLFSLLMVTSMIAWGAMFIF